MQLLKNPLRITKTVRLHRVGWFGYVESIEENIIHRSVLYMN
jgi:hypothetical protein